MRYLYTLLLFLCFLCAFGWAAITAQEPASGGPPIIVLRTGDAAPSQAKAVTPDQVEAIALKWIAVATAIVGALAMFVAFVAAKVQEVKTTVAQHSAQLHALALSAPPPGVSTAAGTTAAVAALILAGMFLSGCAGGKYVGPPLRGSLQYNLPDGSGSVGVSTELDPSFARQKK